MASTETITISKAEYNRFLAMEAELGFLKIQVDQLKRRLFGAKSEKFIASDPAQGSLFEVEPVEVEEKAKQQVSYTREVSKKKKQPLRLELPDHLERVEEVIEPVDLPQGAKKIGEVVTEVLEYEPGKFFVRRIIRPKYLIKTTDEKTEIWVPELPSLPIPKGNAGAGLLAHLLVSKFADHLPFYRQRQMFKRQDVDLAESTLGGWFNASCQLLEPLYGVLKKRLLDTDYLMADESPMPVQTKDKKGATHKGYQWVYYDPVRRLALFDYRQSRGRERPNEMLKEFKGFLQTDGYSVYDNLKGKKEDITLLACMAHARRKFNQAKDNDRARAEQALKMFAELYQVEQQAREQQMNHHQRQQLRQELSEPVLNRIEQWLQQNLDQVAPM